MRHAFQFLEPGGMFEGITSTHWVKAKDAPSRAFAQFVEEHAVHVEDGLQKSSLRPALMCRVCSCCSSGQVKRCPRWQR